MASHAVVDAGQRQRIPYHAQMSRQHRHGNNNIIKSDLSPMLLQSD